MMSLIDSTLKSLPLNPFVFLTIGSTVLTLLIVWAIRRRTPKSRATRRALLYLRKGETLTRETAIKRADDLEEWISSAQAAATSCDREGAAWNARLALHLFLADAYRLRQRGDRAENCEPCIQHYQRALEIATRTFLPGYWARMQYHLAMVYRDRVRGDRAENLERSIQHCEQAMEVATRESRPKEWAMAQNGMGRAYANRLQGNRAENIERAIGHFQLALEIRTRDAFPEDWAHTQNELGLAYNNRIRGDPAENVEQAIHQYQQALEVRTRDDFLEPLGAVQNNLGAAYLARTRGNRAENIEEAIRHFQLALKSRTRDAFPEAWATTQNNLGVAYDDRIRGDPAENKEEAIRRFELALEVRTRDAFPANWATTQNNLANAWAFRVRGEPGENLDRSISHYQAALEITGDTLGRSTAEQNLGLAYTKRIRGDREMNIEAVIRHYHRALKTRTPLAFPVACRNTAHDFGRFLYGLHRFAEARAALTTAHEAVEALRGELSREEAKREVSARNTNLYAMLVYCCLLEGDYSAAFEYATVGKGRAFVDTLATGRLDLSAAGVDSPELAADLDRARFLRRQIDTLLSQVTGDDGLTRGDGRSSSAQNPNQSVSGQMSKELRSLRAQHKALWEDMAYKYPSLTATQQAPVLSSWGARELSRDLGATLVEYFRHAEGWSAFVVTPDTVLHAPLPLLDDDLLQRMRAWLARIESPAGQGRLSYNLLYRMHEAVITPLRDYLPVGGRVILAPFGPMHLMPLSATRDRSTGRYADEDYTLSFAPSLAALRVARDEAHLQPAGASSGGENRLLSIAYPGAPGSSSYLSGVLDEAEVIERYFEQVTPIHEDDATPDAVIAHARGQGIVHFGCHGLFDAEVPAESGLMLSGGWLTVQRIITELRLDTTYLATVAACQSAQMQVRKGEEHVGLLQALMTAGARTVVASLWKVDDAATRVLFEDFYSQIRAGCPPAKALADAAKHVREQPGWEHPYYWAAFQASGLSSIMDRPFES